MHEQGWDVWMHSCGKVNAIIEQIAALNKRISGVEIDGRIKANDLRDRRDLLLEQVPEQ